MPSTRRIRIGRAVILTALAAIAVALMPVFGDTWVTVQPERLYPVESPTGPVGSGLDLPLDGEH